MARRRPHFYHIEVAPLSVLPLNRPPIFSYQSKIRLTPGDWVQVPFGNRVVDGVVYRVETFSTRPPVWMKPVGKVIEPAFLTETQRKLAELVSREYFTPLGKTLRHFLPKRFKIRKQKEGPERTTKKFVATVAEQKFLEQYKKIPAGKIGCYNPSSFSQAWRPLVALAQKTDRGKKQMLILVPEITHFPGLVEAFGEYFDRKKIALLHSKLSGGEYFAAWENIRHGHARVILATRQGLFAPFSDLGLIVCTDEEDESYKQWDMSPRYHARRVAESLAHLSEARLLYASVTPSLDVFLRSETGDYVTLAPLVSEKPLGETLSLVNLKLERFQKNFSPLSKPLTEKIRELLREKKQVLLSVARQGLSFFSVCENCKNIFRCPRCGRALENTAEGYFQCRACGYRTALFPGCPTCRHLSFRHIGFGTQRVEREIKKVFPAARVFRADGSTMKSRKKIEEWYTQWANKEIDILIGTRMILRSFPLPDLGLTAIIDADSLLSFPDFRADERYFQELYRLAHLVERKTDGVVVQTFHPESTLNQRVVALSPREIYQGILEERKLLSYPPCSRSLLLIHTEKTRAEALGRLPAVKAELEKIVEKLGGKITLLSEEPLYRKKDRVYEQTLSVRIPDGSLLPPSLVTFLQKLPPTFRVDVDPLSLFT